MAEEKSIKEAKPAVRPAAASDKDKPIKKAPQEAKEIKVPAKFKDLVKQIEELTVSDLAELVKILENKFGVSAGPAISAATVAEGAASAGGEAVVEKSSFDLELKSGGDQKIAVIKIVKEITGQGLKESKDLVDGAPKVIKQGLKKEEAEEMKKKLEEVGAAVELK